MNSNTKRLFRHWFKLILTGVFLTLPTGALAVEIRGFGSATYIQTDSNISLFDYGTTQSKPNFSKGTDFGINLHQNITDAWSASAQLLANSESDDFNINLEWGFIAYKPNHHFSVRAGRIVIPAWLNSQQINVGFNYPWIYLPVEVYALNPFHSFNGASVMVQFELGPGVIEGHLYGGDGAVTVHGSFQNQRTTSIGKAQNTLGGELSYNLKETVLFRLGYLQTLGSVVTSTPFTLPAGTLGASQPTPLTLSTTSTVDLGLARFISAGLKVDYNNLFFESEFVRRLFDGAEYKQASGFYASVGYRIWDFMPLFTWSWQGALSGTAYFHPDYPNTTTLLTGKKSSTFGLNYFLTDFMVLKSSISFAKQNFQDSSKDLSPTVYALSANFIF